MTARSRVCVREQNEKGKRNSDDERRTRSRGYTTQCVVRVRAHASMSRQMPCRTGRKKAYGSTYRQRAWFCFTHQVYQPRPPQHRKASPYLSHHNTMRHHQIKIPDALVCTHTHLPPAEAQSASSRGRAACGESLSPPRTHSGPDSCKCTRGGSLQPSSAPWCSRGRLQNERVKSGRQSSE